MKKYFKSRNEKYEALQRIRNCLTNHLSYKQYRAIMGTDWQITVPKVSNSKKVLKLLLELREIQQIPVCDLYIIPGERVMKGFSRAALRVVS